MAPQRNFHSLMNDHLTDSKLPAENALQYAAWAWSIKPSQLIRTSCSSVRRRSRSSRTLRTATSSAEMIVGPGYDHRPKLKISTGVG